MQENAEDINSDCVDQSRPRSLPIEDVVDVMSTNRIEATGEEVKHGEQNVDGAGADCLKKMEDVDRMPSYAELEKHSNRVASVDENV